MVPSHKFASLLAGELSHAELDHLSKSNGTPEELPGGITLLHAAALGGSADAVAALVAGGGVGVDAPLGAPHLLLRSAELVQAAVQSDQGLIPMLHQGSTPLMLACQMVRPEAARALLAAGANACAVNDYLHTPLAWVEDRAAMQRVPGALCDELRAMLLEAGADPLAPYFNHVTHATVLDASVGNGGAPAHLAALQARHAAGALQLPRPSLLEVIRAAVRCADAAKQHRAYFLRQVWQGPEAGTGWAAGEVVELVKLVVELADQELLASVLRSELGAALRSSGQPDGVVRMALSAGVDRQAEPGMIATALDEGADQGGLWEINHCLRQGKVEVLELLLERGGAPAVPLGTRGNPVDMRRHQWHRSWPGLAITCPFFTLLRAGAAGVGGPAVNSHTRARMAEALLRAGMRPTVLAWVRLRLCRAAEVPAGAIVENRSLVRRDYSVCEEAAEELGLATANRVLWRMIAGQPWCPDEHPNYPPAFKAAARALLLTHAAASSRLGQGGESTSTLLALLPHEVLLHVLRQAAYPLSGWLED